MLFGDFYDKYGENYIWKHNIYILTPIDLAIARLKESAKDNKKSMKDLAYVEKNLDSKNREKACAILKKLMVEYSCFKEKDIYIKETCIEQKTSGYYHFEDLFGYEILTHDPGTRRIELMDSP